MVNLLELQDKFRDEMDRAVADIDLRALSDIFKSKDLTLMLVGGAVRHFIMNGTISRDLDFEIRAKEDCDATNIGELEPDLLNFLGYSKSNIGHLPYGIFRIISEKFSLEFSFPRIERFRDGDYSHKNFEITTVKDLNYIDAARRRDFTINSIGILFGDSVDIKIVDPFDGVNDIYNRTLRSPNPDFARDPVRLLRAVRFKTALGFEYSNELKIAFKKCNLTHNLAYYMGGESLKGKNPFAYVRELDQVVSENQILLHLESRRFIDLMKRESTDRTIVDRKELISFLVKSNLYSNQELVFIANFLGVKQSLIKKR